MREIHYLPLSLPPTMTQKSLFHVIVGGSVRGGISAKTTSTQSQPFKPAHRGLDLMR